MQARPEALTKWRTKRVDWCFNYNIVQKIMRLSRVGASAADPVSCAAFHPLFKRVR